MNDTYRDIGKRVAEVRRANKLTQNNLAEKMDICTKHCSYVECGKSTFSLEKMIKFCDMFDVSLDYLVRGKK